MTGYVRQSVSDIVPGATVRSDPVNAEFNQLRDAFAFDNTGNTGHKHDGSVDQGSYIPLIGDVDGLNRVEVDTNTNTITLSVEVGGLQAPQFSVQDGVIVPVTTNDIDIGTTGTRFKDLYLSGTAFPTNLNVSTSSTFGGLFTITGAVAANINMNNFRHVNLGVPVDPNDGARLVDVTTIAGSASAAAASAAQAEAALDEFTDQYLGPLAADPATDNDGNPLVDGTLYTNTTTGNLRVYILGGWTNGVTAITGILAAANNLSDVDSVVTSRANLGLGSIATQNANSVTVTGGTISGITDLAVVDGGTGSSTAAGARTNLGVVNSTAAEQRYDQVSASATVTAFDQVAINASSAFTLTLPSSPTTGDWVEFSVVSGDATVNNITVDGAGSGTVNGDPDLIIDLNNVAVVVQYNGSEWRVY